MAEETIFIEYQIPQNESGSITQVIRKNFTRAEAIERMELAMKKYAQDAEIYTDKDLARVALNALLGE